MKQFDLEKKLAEFKEHLTNSNLIQNCIEIAQGVGNYTKKTDSDWRANALYEFDKAGLAIELEVFGFGDVEIRVFEKAIHVFCAKEMAGAALGRDELPVKIGKVAYAVKTYFPGEWEERVKTLYDDLKTPLADGIVGLDRFLEIGKPGPVSKLALEKLLVQKAEELKEYRLIEKCIELAVKSGSEKDSGDPKVCRYSFHSRSFYLSYFVGLGEAKAVSVMESSQSAGNIFFDAVTVKEKDDDLHPFVETKYGLFKIQFHRPHAGEWLDALDVEYCKIGQEVSAERLAVLRKNFSL